MKTLAVLVSTVFAITMGAVAAMAQTRGCAAPLLPEMTPQAAYDSLLAGNARFVQGKLLPRNVVCARDTTANGERPFAVVLNCMDSRTSPEYLFDRGLGELFSLRVAGNVFDHNILGSMEYAVINGGVKVIAVVGHTGCGAVHAAVDRDYKFLNITDVLVKMEPAIQSVDPALQPRTSRNADFVEAVTIANVVYVMDQVAKRSPALKILLDNKRVKLVAGIHDVRTGQVRFMWEYQPRN